MEWCVNPQPQQQYLNTDNIKSGSVLTEELEMNAINDPVVTVYKAYSGMLKRDQPGFDQATKHLTELLKTRPTYVPGIVALAVLKFLQKKDSDVTT